MSIQANQKYSNVRDMKGIVYIVHCIDTEGPLYESIEATFERVNSAFGFSFEPSYENLNKLQKKEIPLSGKEDAVATLVSQRRLNYKDNWVKIDEMLDEITSEKFRNELKDSFCGNWIYNWFCLDHVGFTGDNPRRRDLGHHNIFDHYRLYNKLNKITKDMIQWHFHPLAFIKDAHRSGTAYVSSSMPFEILARKIIERNWFPSAYRPGFHTERPDSHWFLEQWIPFDYANQAVKGIPTDQPDLADGRFGDWRRAPAEWVVYHPDHDDYQKEGNCRRWIARCLNMDARLREININDFRDGFERTKTTGKSTLISFTNHDFRDMKPEINKIRKMLKQVSEEYPNIKFKFTNAVEAMRGVLQIKKKTAPGFTAKLEEKSGAIVFRIYSKNDIFGPQPFLAIKTNTSDYYWDNLDFQGKNEWSYTFDFNTLAINSVAKIGIAGNTASGVTEIFVYDVKSKTTTTEILNLE